MAFNTIDLKTLTGLSHELKLVGVFAYTEKGVKSMKFTIEGFSQEYALTLQKEVLVKGRKKRIKVDCNDLVILRWFVDFYPKMMKVEIEGKQYAWIKYQALLEDLPLLDIKKRMLFDRLQKLVDFGILSHKSIKSGGSFSYYGFGDNYIKLVDDSFRIGVQKIADGQAENCKGVSNELPTVTQETAEQIDSSIKDTSIKEPSIKEGIYMCEENTPETKLFKIGKFNNVLISYDNISKLGVEYGQELATEAIEYLSSYINMKGSYDVDHYGAICHWVIDAVKNKKKTTKKSKAKKEPVVEARSEAVADGKHQNVYLTVDEYYDLSQQTSVNEVYDAVEFLSEYLYNNPNKKYASHYQAIKDWVFTAVKERRLKQQELELKEAELEQRKERIAQIEERNEQFVLSNGKRISDLTHAEYLEKVSGEPYKPTAPVYNWLEN